MWPKEAVSAMQVYTGACCHQSLVKLAELNRIQLVWVTSYMGIDGNEIADGSAKQGSSHSLIGPEPALGIPAKVARGVIRDWTSRKHEAHWQTIHGQRQSKGFLKKKNPSAKKVGELLILSRNQLRILTGLLTGHCHLIGHLIKLGLVNIPEFDRCK